MHALAGREGAEVLCFEGGDGQNLFLKSVTGSWLRPKTYLMNASATWMP
jgi:hypothetical protein